MPKPNPIAKTVSFADVKSGRTKIVGRLGMPISDVAVISGKWRFESIVRAEKSSRADFVVETVNGKKLSADMIFQHTEIKKLSSAKGVHEKDGLNQSLLVFESIMFGGVPAAVFRPRVPRLQLTRAPGFYSTLNIVRAEKE